MSKTHCDKTIPEGQWTGLFCCLKLVWIEGQKAIVLYCGVTDLAYIYKIYNDINDKIYVGKTYLNIQKRFAEHCKDFKKFRCEKRPLYNAMRKHGIEHFYIELVEETDDPEQREVFWIDYYDSYHNGYNATRGGDGKPFLDHDEIIKEYMKSKNAAEVARMFNASACQVRNILKSNGIEIKNDGYISRERLSKPVNMVDVDSGMTIQSFESVRAAARYIIKNGMTNSSIGGVSGRISAACIGSIRSAYGYRWRHA